MNLQEGKPSPKTILRLTDVLGRTGLSRATLYNRIAKGEFPHQVSLGGRAVGWLQGEVEDWINERTHLRSGLAKGIWESRVDDGVVIPKGTRPGRQGTRPGLPTNCRLSTEDGSPDPAQLHLVGTKIYFDKSTGSFWLKLIPENPQGVR
jgi:prophage regulatory protein